MHCVHGRGTMSRWPTGRAPGGGPGRVGPAEVVAHFSLGTHPGRSGAGEGDYCGRPSGVIRAVRVPVPVPVRD